MKILSDFDFQKIRENPFIWFDFPNVAPLLPGTLLTTLL